MKIKKYLSILFLGVAMASCTDLDIPPMNIVGDQDIFGNTAGVQSYMARMYSTLPVEDFRYSHANMFFSGGANYAQPSCLTGEAVSRDTHGAEIENPNYWNAAYAAIREINYFIVTLPKFESAHGAAEVDHLLGEASFLRAYTYYALAKRYGGVPVIDKVIDYPASVSIPETQLIRNSEEETWDFISKDLDYAIKHMKTTSQKGRANKYVAAAFKSRTMLHAGTIAKYNEVNEVYKDKRICGIAKERAVDYFKQAYAASKIVDEGGYELYKGEWKAGDKGAQYENFVNIFQKDTKENIFVKYFKYKESVHSYDCFAQPTQTSSGGSNTEICPTLDFVEMFEGFEKDSNGKFKNLDSSGNYNLYTTTMDPFKDAEPRLRATVILPGDMFKGQSIEIRRGIWVGEGDKIKPLLPEGTYNFYDDYSAYVDEATSLLKLAKRESQNTDANAITLKDGTKMRRAGKSGSVKFQEIGCTVSGFLIRKYLNPEQTNTNWNESSQDWIDIRYAEVLLNRAEAAMELEKEGVASDISGDNYRDMAFNCVNKIRERAGATLLATSAKVSIENVRVERRKELSFENKTYWDLKRWRIIDKEQSSRTYRTLQPFFAADAMKYFMDIKLQEQGGKVYTFDSRNYYQQIPNGEITKNPNCKQNPGY
ncbi:MAG: RagB/SusD family nutrient uptake outer membrane protein [Muribaculaceae bacterium]